MQTTLQWTLMVLSLIFIDIMSVHMDTLDPENKVYLYFVFLYVSAALNNNKNVPLIHNIVFSIISFFFMTVSFHHSNRGSF